MFDVGLVVGESWMGSGRTGEAEVVEQREGAQKRVVQRAPLTHSIEPSCHLQRAWQTPTRSCLGGSTPTNGLEYLSWLQDLPERQDEVSELVCVCATPWASLYGDKLCGMFDVGLVVGESWMGSGRTGEAEVVEQREGAQKRVVQRAESWVGSGRTGEAEVVEQREGAQKRVVQHLLRTQPNLHLTYNGRGKHRLGAASAARLRPTDSSIGPGCKISRSAKMRCPSLCVCATPWASLYGDKLCGMFDVGLVVGESWMGSGRTGEAEVVEQREGAQKRVVQRAPLTHSIEPSCHLQRAWQTPTRSCLGGSTPTNGLEYLSWLQDLPERQDEVSELVCVCATPWASLYGDKLCGMFDVGLVVGESWMGSGRTGEAEVVEQREGAQKRVVQHLLRTQPNLNITYNGRGKHRLGAASAARLRPTDSSIGPGCKISRSAKMRCESWMGSGRTGEAEVVEQREGAQKRVVQRACLGGSTPTNGLEYRSWLQDLPERQDEVSEPVCVCHPWDSLYGDKLCGMFDVGLVVSESWMGSGRTGEAEVVEQREGAQKRVVQRACLGGSTPTNGLEYRSWLQDLPERQDEVSEPVCVCHPWDSLYGDKLCGMFDVGLVVGESWMGSGRTGEAEVVEQREGAQKRVVQRACLGGSTTTNGLEYRSWLQDLPERQDEVSEPVCVCHPWDSLYGDKLCGMFDVGLVVSESWMGSGRTGEAEVVEQREGAQKRVVQRAPLTHSTEPHVTYNGRGKHRLGAASAARLRPTDSSIGPGCKISRSAKMRCPSLESWMGSGRTGEAEVVEQREGAQKRVVQRAPLTHSTEPPFTYNGRGKHRLGAASAARLRPTDSSIGPGCKISRSAKMRCPSLCVCATPWASLYGDKLCGMFDVGLVVGESWMGSGRTGEAEVVEQREGAQKRVVQHLLRTQPNLHVTYNGRGKHRLGAASAARLRPTDSSIGPGCKISRSAKMSGRTGEAEVVEQREGAQKRVVQRACLGGSTPTNGLEYRSWLQDLPERQDEVSELVCVCATPWASLYGDKLCGMFDVGLVVGESWMGSGRTGEAEVVEQREGAQKRVVQRALYGDKLCGMFDVGLVVGESWMGSGRTGEAEVVEQREGAQKRVVQRACLGGSTPTNGLEYRSWLQDLPERQDEVSEPVCVCATPWASLYGDKLCGMFDVGLVVGESWMGSGRTGEAEVVEQREGAQKRVVQRACLGGSTPTNGLEYRSWLQDLPERQDEVSEPVCVCATPWASLYGDKLCGMFDVGLVVSESWMGSGRTGEAEVVEQREGAQKRVVQRAPLTHSTEPHVTYNGRGKHRLGAASAARLRPTDSSIGPGCKISRSAKMRCPSLCVCATPWASLYGDKLCGMFDVGLVVGESWMGSGRTGEAEVVEQREGAQKRVVQRAPLTHSTEPSCHLQRAWQTPTRSCLGGSTPTNGLEYRSWLQDLPERQDEVSEPVCVCATPWASLYGDKLCGMFDVGSVVSESWVGSGRTGEAEVVEQREGAQKRVVQHLLRTQPNLMSPTTGVANTDLELPRRLDSTNGLEYRSWLQDLPERQDEVSEPVCVCATPWASLYGDKLCGMFDVGLVVGESWMGSGRTGEAEVVEQREGAQKRVVQRACTSYALNRTSCHLQRAWQTPTRSCLGGSTPTNGLEYRSWLQDLPERQDEVSEPVCVCATPWASLYGDKLCGMFDVGSVVSESWMGSGRTGEAEVVEQREGAQKRVVQRAPLTHSTEPSCHLQRAWQTPTRSCLGGSTPTNGLEYRSWLQDLPERQDEVSELVCVCATPWASLYGDKLCGMFDVGSVVSESWVGSGRTGEAEVVEQREGAQKRVVQHLLRTQPNLHVTYNGRGKHRLGAASAARLRPTDSSIGPGCKISRSAKMSGRTGEAEVVEQREGAQKRVVQRAPLTHSTEPHVTYNGRGKHRLGAASAARLRPTDSSIGPGCKISRSAKMSGRTGEAEVVEQREGAQKRVVQRACTSYALNRTFMSPTTGVANTDSELPRRLDSTNGLEYRSWLQDLPERQDEVSELVCVCATPWASLYGDKLCGMFDVGSVVSESWVGSGRTGEAEVVEQREGAQKRVVQHLLRTQPNLHVTYNGRGKHRLGAASAARQRPTDSSIGPGCKISRSAKMSGRTGEAEVVEQREGAQKRVVQRACTSYALNRTFMSPTTGVANTDSELPRRLDSTNGLEYRSWLQDLPERQDEVSELVCVCATPWASLYGDKLCGMFDVGSVVSESWVGSGRTGEAEVVEQREGAQKRVVQRACLGGSTTTNGLEYRSWLQDLPERQDEVSELVCVCATPWASLYGDKLCGMFDVGSVVSESWVGSGRTGEAEVVEQREGAQKRVVQRACTSYALNRTFMSPTTGVANTDSELPRRLDSTNGLEYRSWLQDLPERQDEVSELVCVCATPWASLYGDKLCGMFDVGSVVSESWVGSGRTGEAEVVEQREGAQKRVVQPQSVEHSANNAAVQGSSPCMTILLLSLAYHAALTTVLRGFSRFWRVIASAPDLLRTQPNLHVTYNGRGKHRLGAASAARQRPTDSNLPERQDEVSELVCVCATPWASLYGDKLCGMFDVGSVVSESWVGSGRTGEAEVVEQREGAQKRVVQPQSVEHSANNAAVQGSSPCMTILLLSLAYHAALTTVLRGFSRFWRVIASAPDLLRTQPNLHVTYNGRGKHRLGAASAARQRPTDSNLPERQDEVSELVCVCATPWASLYGDKLCGMFDVGSVVSESWVGSGRTGEAEVVEQREGAQKRVVQPQSVEHSANNAAVQGSSPYLLRTQPNLMSPTTGVANTDSELPRRLDNDQRTRVSRQDEVSELVCVCATPWASLYGDKLCGMFDVGSVVSESWVGSGRTGEAEVVEQREGAQKRVVQPQSVEHSANNAAVQGSSPCMTILLLSLAYHAALTTVLRGFSRFWRVIASAPDLLRTQPNLHVTYNGRGKHRLGAASAARQRPTDSNLPERQDEVSELVCVCATPWASLYGDKLCGMFDVGSVVSESWVGSGRTGEAEVVEQREGAQKRVVQPQSVEHSANNAAVQGSSPCMTILLLSLAYHAALTTVLRGFSRFWRVIASAPDLLRTQPNLHVTYNGRGKHRLGAASAARLRPTDSNLPERQDEVSELVCVCATPWASLYGDKLCGMFDVGSVVSESWVGSGRTGEAEVVEQREGAQKRVVQRACVSQSTSYALNRTFMSPTTGVANTDSELPRRLDSTNGLEYRSWLQDLPERQDEVSELVCVCATPWASLYGDKLCGMFDVGSVVSESWVGSGRTGEAEVVEQREGAQKRVVQPQSVEHSANNAAVQGSSPCMTILLLSLAYHAALTTVLRGFSRFWRVIASAPDLLRTQPNLHVTYNGRGKHRLGAASAARQRPTDSNLPERQDEVSELVCVCATPWASLYGDKLCGMFDVGSVVSESWVGSGRTGEAEVVEQREGAQKRVVQPQSVEHSANNAAVQGSSPCMTILLLSLAYHAALTTVLRGFSRFWRVIASAPDLLRTQPNLHVTYNGRGKHRLGAASAARQRPTDSNLPERQDEVSELVCVCATPWASLYGDKLCGMFDVGSVVSESWVGSGRTGEAEVVEQREGAQKRVVQPQSVEHSANNAAVQGSSPCMTILLLSLAYHAALTTVLRGFSRFWRVIASAPDLLRTQPNLHVTYNGRGKHRLGAASAARQRPTDSNLPERQDEVSEPVCVCATPWASLYGDKLCGMFDVGSVVSESWVGSGRTGEAEVVEQREGAQKRVVQPQSVEHSANNAAVQDLLRTQPNLHVTYNGRGKHRLGAASAARLRPTDSNLPERQDEVSELVCFVRRQALWDVRRWVIVSESWVGSGRTGEAEVVEQREGAQKRVVQHLLRTQPNLHVTYNGRGKHRLGAASAARLRPTDSSIGPGCKISRSAKMSGRTGEAEVVEQREGAQKRVVQRAESWVGSGRTGEAEVVEQREGAQKRVVQPQSVEHSANNAAVQGSSPCMTILLLSLAYHAALTTVLRGFSRFWRVIASAPDLLRTQPNLHVTYNGRGKHRLGAASAARLRPTDSNLPERQDEVSEPVCVCATPWASLYGDKLCGMFDSWVGSGRTGEAEVVEQREGAQKRVVQPQSVEHSANNAAVQGSSPCMTILLLSLAYHAALTTVLRGFSRFWRAIASAPDLLRTQPNLHVTYNGRGKHRLGAASAARLRPTDSNLPERQDEVSEPVCVCATPWASLYGDKLCGMFDVGLVVSESWVGSGRTGEAEVVEQREGAQKRVVQPQSVEHSANNAAVQDLLRTQPNLHVTYNGRGKHRLGAASAARLRPTDSNLPERQDEVSEPVCVCATPWASLYGDKLCGMFDSWVGSGRTGEAEVVEQREGAQKRVVQPQSVEHSANNAAVQGSSPCMTILLLSLAYHAALTTVLRGFSRFWRVIASAPDLLRTQPNLHVTYNGRGKHRLGAASAARQRPTDSNLPERQDEVSEPVCVCATPWASLYGDKLCGMFDVGSVVSESWVGSGRTGEAEVVEQREGAQKRVVQPQSVEHSANNAAVQDLLRTQPNLHVTYNGRGKHRLGAASAARLRPTDSNLPERQDEVSEPFVRRQALWDVRRWVVVSESWVGSGRTGEAEVVEQREGAQKRVVQRACLGGSTPTNGLEYRSWLQDLPERQDEVSEPVCVCATPWASLYGDKLCGMFDVGLVVSESWVGSGRTGEAEVVEQREGAQKRVVQRACTSYALNRTFMSPTTGVANTDSELPRRLDSTNGLEYRSWLQDLPERQDEVSEPVCVCATPWASLYGDKLCGMFDVGLVVSESWMGSGRTGEAEVVEQREGAQKRVVQPQSVEHSANNAAVQGSSPCMTILLLSLAYHAALTTVLRGFSRFWRVIASAPDLLRTQPNLHVTYNGRGKHRLGAASAARLRPTDSNLPERQDEVSEPVCVCATPWASLYGDKLCGMFDWADGEAEVVEQREGAQKRVVQPQSVEHSANNAAVQDLLRTQPNLHVTYNGRGKHRLGAASAARLRPTDSNLPERQDEVSEPVCVCATPWASLYGDKLCGMFDVGLVVSESWMGSGRTGEAEVVEQREGAQKRVVQRAGRTGEAEVVEQREGAQKRVVQPQSVEHSANNAAVQGSSPCMTILLLSLAYHAALTTVLRGFSRFWRVIASAPDLLRTQPNLHVTYNGRGKHRLGAASAARLRPTDSNLPERQDEVSEPVCVCATPWASLYGDKLCGMFDSWMGSGRTGEAEVVEQREGAQKRVVQPQSVEHSANNAAVQGSSPYLLRTQPNLHVTYNGRGKHRLGAASAARLRPTDSNLPERQDEVSEPVCVCATPWASLYGDKLCGMFDSWVGSGRTGEAEVVEQREGAQKRVVQPQSVEHSANNAAVQDLLRTQPNLHVTYNGRGKHRLGAASAARLRPTDSNLPERQDEVSEPVCVCATPWASLYGDKLCGMFDVGLIVSESWMGSGRTGEAEVVEQREGAQKRVVQPQSVEHSANNAAVQGSSPCMTILLLSLAYHAALTTVLRGFSRFWRVIASAPDLLRTQPNLHVTYNGRGKHRLGAASAARLRPTDSNLPERQDEVSEPVCVCATPWASLYGDKLCGMFDWADGEAEVVEQREGAQKRVVQRACVSQSTSYALNRTSMSPTTGVANTDSELPRRLDSTNGLEYRSWLQDLPERQDEVSEPVCVCATPWASLYGDKLCGMFDVGLIVSESWVGSGRTGEAEVVEQREGAQKRVVQRACLSR
ncbi:hypothetical protein PInf_012286 [Phytophthora infestans]|nr:hypothetical protein PInf_012286 [Phytophthora infestans]